MRPSSAPVRRRSPLRRLLWPSLASLIAMAILLNLGFWQIRRLHQKEALLARIDARIHQPATPVPPAEAWASLDLDKLEYLPVTARGQWLNNKEALVFDPAGKGDGGMATKGFWVLTPLRLDSGAIIIVNRGFVPEDKGPADTRRQGQLSGEQQVSGLLRLSQSRNIFTPPDDPAKGQWFTKDPAAIGRWFKLGNVAPFIIDADATPNPGGWPRGGATTLDIPNRHLEYAVTWFGLSLTLLGVYAFFARAVLAQGRQDTGQNS